jgi:hypothetical protein
MSKIKTSVKKISIVLFILLGFTSVHFSITTKANAKQGIEFSPSKVELSLKPGDESEFELVINSLSENLDFTLKKGAFSENTYDFESKDLLSPSRWLNIDEAKVYNLTKGTPQKILIKLKLPNNVLEGSYMPIVGVLIKPQPKETLQDVSSATIDQLIPYPVRIFVSKTGEYKSGLVIDSFGTDSTVNFSETLNFNIELANNSGLYFSKPTAYFQVLNQKGEVMYQEVINESLAYILTNSSLSKKIQVKLPATDGSLITKYTAELLVVDNLFNESSIKKINFYVVRSNYLLLVIVVSIILLMFIFILFKKLKRKWK